LRQQPALLQRRLRRGRAQTPSQEQSFAVTHPPHHRAHHVDTQATKRPDSFVTVDDAIASRRRRDRHHRQLLAVSLQARQQTSLQVRPAHTQIRVAQLQLVVLQLKDSVADRLVQNAVLLTRRKATLRNLPPTKARYTPCSTPARAVQIACTPGRRRQDPVESRRRPPLLARVAGRGSVPSAPRDWHDPPQCFGSTCWLRAARRALPHADSGGCSTCDRDRIPGRCTPVCRTRRTETSARPSVAGSQEGPASSQASEQDSEPSSSPPWVRRSTMLPLSGILREGSASTGRRSPGRPGGSLHNDGPRASVLPQTRTSHRRHDGARKFSQKRSCRPGRLIQARGWVCSTEQGRVISG
jgi:hypothetical protein